jgi:hypothetical protein
MSKSKKPKLPPIDIDLNYGGFKDEMTATLFNSKHIPPNDNAALRREFNVMAREVLDGRDPYGGNGGGPKGWAHHFRTKFGITAEHAAELAERLGRTMVGRNG